MRKKDSCGRGSGCAGNGRDDARARWRSGMVAAAADGGHAGGFAGGHAGVVLPVRATRAILPVQATRVTSPPAAISPGTVAVAGPVTAGTVAAVGTVAAQDGDPVWPSDWA